MVGGVVVGGVVLGGVVVVVVGGGGGGDVVVLVVVLGRGLVVDGGRGLVVVVGTAVVVGASVTDGTSGARPGRLDGTGNGSRVVPVAGGMSSDVGALAQPSTPSVSTTAPAASAPVRRKRTCKEAAPIERRR